MIFRPILIIFGLFILSATGAAAQNAKFAVLDVEKVLNDSLAGKSIQAQLSARREAFQKEFSSREDNLVSAERSLIEKKSEMSADNFATKRKEFETQLLETRNLFQKRRNSLDKGLTSALADLRKNVIEVAAKVADEGGYEVVLTRNSVVIVQKEMDITEAVLARLNSKIQSIKLDVVQ
jgi:Skp family chaperone for outer membrane proteins